MIGLSAFARELHLPVFAVESEARRLHVQIGIGRDLRPALDEDGAALVREKDAYGNR